MTTLREAAQQALDALEVATTPRSEDRQTVLKAQAALRTALANHSERDLEMVKPVAWIFTWYEIAKDRHVRRIIDCEERPNIPGYDLIPLYTAPPKQQAAPFSPDSISTAQTAWKMGYETAKAEMAEQPEPEPVAVVVAAEYEDGSHAGHRLEWRGRNEANDYPEGTEFYITPPARRKPLTDKEIIKIWNDMGNDPIAPSVFSFIACVRKTEQAHGIGGEE